MSAAAQLHGEVTHGHHADGLPVTTEELPIAEAKAYLDSKGIKYVDEVIRRKVGKTGAKK